MNDAELMDLLLEMAECDLNDGARLKDHPCYLAVRRLINLKEGEEK